MKYVLLSILLLLLLLPGCTGSDLPAPEETAESIVFTEETLETITFATASATELPTPPSIPSEPASPAPLLLPVLELTAEEKNMLLKIGMAERGRSGCAECVALVMCTVLNRVEAGGFGSSIRSVILAQDQFTPVSDGSYYKAEPNELCYDALEMVLYGWDESQGALYYEWCEGESWHSKNLHLLFQHCDTRFYDKKRAP